MTSKREMGLYGTIIVEPRDPSYWPGADRDVVLTLDDILIEVGRVAPFDPMASHTRHAQQLLQQLHRLHARRVPIGLGRNVPRRADAWIARTVARA